MLADFGIRVPAGDSVSVLRDTELPVLVEANRGGDPCDVDGVDVSASGEACVQKDSRLGFDSADLGWRRSGDSARLKSGEPGSALLGLISDLRVDDATAAAAGTSVGGDAFRPAANTCGDWAATTAAGW